MARQLRPLSYRVSNVIPFSAKRIFLVSTSFPRSRPSELRLVLTLFASEGKVHFASRSQSAGGALDWRPLATVMSLNGAETCARQ